MAAHARRIDINTKELTKNMNVPGTPTPDTQQPPEPSSSLEQYEDDQQVVSTLPATSEQTAQQDINTTGALDTPTVEEPYYAQLQPPKQMRNSWRRIVGITLLVIGLIMASILTLRHSSQSQHLASAGLNLKQQTTSLTKLNQELTAPASNATLTVNGQLAINGQLNLTPSAQPTNGAAGQLYYDQKTNQLGYYNGSAFVYLQGGGAAVTNITNITNTTIAAGTSGLGGSGTAGTVALFSGTGSLGNSAIHQNGTSVTVNGTTKIASSTNSTAALQVQNANGTNIFSTDTTNSAVVLGNDGLSPTASTLRGGAGVGNNISGTNLVIAGSNGTGSANGGDIILETGQSPQGGIQLDNAGHYSSDGATVSTNFAIGTEKDRILIVSTNWATSSVTYDGRPLTSLASTSSAQHFGGGAFTEIWYLLNPPTGTFVLTATAGGGGTAMGVAAYYNVNQATPFGTPVTATSSVTGTQSTGVSVSTSNTSQIVIDAMSADKDGSLENCTPTSGQTTRWAIVQQFFAVGCGADIVANGGVTSIGWTVSNVDWVDIGVVVNPAVAGSAPLQQIGGSTPDTLFDRVHITSSGNVGIDNNNPQYTLDVNGVSNAAVATYSPIFDTASSGLLAIGNLNATSIQIGNASSNIATSILGTTLIKPTPGNNSTTAFQIQNANNAPILTADTTNTTITIAGNATSFAILNLNNAHLRSTQTTPPTVATPINCGTNPTASVTAGSTDTAGSFSVTAGTGSPTTCDTTITFNKAYTAAPKSIIVTPTIAVGGATNSLAARVLSVSNTSFTIQFTPVNAVANLIYALYYLIIE